VEERLTAEHWAPWGRVVGLFFFSPLHQFDFIKLTAAQGEENKLNSSFVFSFINSWSGLVFSLGWLPWRSSALNPPKFNPIHSISLITLLREK
jgi:hypothetical protein